MKYSKEFKLDCIKKYKKGEYIEAPFEIKKCDNFMRQVRRWNKTYDSLGEIGLDPNRPTLSFDEKMELIRRVEDGESYQSTALSAGMQAEQLIRLHKIYMEKGIDGLKSLKRGRPSMNKIKSKTDKDIEKMSDKEKAKYYKKLFEEKEAEVAYLKKLKALVQQKPNKK